MTNHIENSDRGITLTKSLAWTLLVGLVAGGFWVGTELAQVQGKVDRLSQQFVDLKDDRALSLSSAEAAASQMTSRIRDLERNEARTSAQMAELARVLSRIENSLQSIDTRLRNQETQQ